MSAPLNRRGERILLDMADARPVDHTPAWTSARVEPVLEPAGEHFGLAAWAALILFGTVFWTAIFAWFLA